MIGGHPPLRKLVLDVDTGVDDALALLLALGHPAADVLAIGTVAGNVEVDKCTANTLRVLELKGRPDVPVAPGAERPLLGPLHHAAYVHGDDGLGNVELPPPRWAPSSEHAVDQIVRLAHAHPGAIALVAVGPLTNVALALMRESRLPELIGELIVMGGAFVHPGNMTAHAEFNIWVDPDAARIVLEAGFKTTIVPLDATMRVLLTDDHLARLPESPVAAFARAVTRDYLSVYERNHGRRAAAMHDPLAAAIALDRTLMVDAPDWAVSVETAGTWTRGMTVADRRARPREPLPSGRATVCLEPDAERFFELFLDALS